jgi:phytoene dehydrogenase-like protein
MAQVDAIVIGSGPNGLAAAITLARAGWSVRIYEAKATVGGGMRSAELTLPGFIHDICSSIHPLGMGSPFFQSVPLGDYGVEWIQPELPFAHPLDGGQAAALARSVEETAESLGRDGANYRRLMQPLVKDWDRIAAEILRPLRIPPHHPFALARFGIPALLAASWLAKLLFRDDPARALIAGLAAHSFLPMELPPSASFGLVLGTLGHVVGWPLPKGGSQKIADALADYFRSLGGEIILDHPVENLDALPKARAYLFDTSPRQLLTIAGDRLPEGYKAQLSKYRYGPGVFKMDWALSEPIPWAAEAPRKAGTVHIGGTLAEISVSEKAIWHNHYSERPFVLLAQHSRFDPTRAPDGKHTAWAYCHVPPGSTVDRSDAIENQIERFAPGFKDTILARHTMNTLDYQTYNGNYIGGDINGGVQDFLQLFTRPVMRLKQYATPARGIYLCSASTPPGGGVHGMCGYFAARTALRDLS